MTAGWNATQRELEILELRKENAHLRAQLASNAQAVPVPVAWRLTDGEGDYEYLTEEPSDQSRAWSRRYGREWEPLYASPVSSTTRGTPSINLRSYCEYCDKEYSLHHDEVSGFHHVVRCETVPCAISSTNLGGPDA